jgi:exodeoxyribonuclease VII small subunit
MTYKEALEELKNLSRELETKELEPDEIEKLLVRAKDLSDFCKSTLRSLHGKIQAFQTGENEEPTP